MTKQPNSNRQTMYVTTEAIGKRLGVSRKTVLRWIRSAGLPAVRESETGPWIVLESALDEWMQDFVSRCAK